MIALDRDILVRVSGSNPDQQLLSHLQQYSHDEWTIPAVVAWESYKAASGRSQMLRTQRVLDETFDRILNLTDNVALEAAYLGDKLAEQGVSLGAADLLNLATAHEAGATFVTHNSDDFDKSPIHQLVDLDVVVS
jgi:tRNA(fMet)-specific endonuclease VapC